MYYLFFPHLSAGVIPHSSGDCDVCTLGATLKWEKGKAMSPWHMRWLPPFQGLFSIRLDAQDR